MLWFGKHSFLPIQIRILAVTLSAEQRDENNADPDPRVPVILNHPENTEIKIYGKKNNFAMFLWRPASVPYPTKIWIRIHANPEFFYACSDNGTTTPFLQM